MPETNDTLYSRGRYRLEWDRKRDGSLRTPFLQIVWYDAPAGRNRSRSTGTADVSAAEAALDRLYLERERGQAVCEACGRPFDGAGEFLVTTAIADYLAAREDKPSFQTIRPRAAHVLQFLDATDRLGLACERVDSDVIEEFRKWSARQPVIEGGVPRDRAPGTTEGSVGTWAAAINFAHRRKDTLHPAGFTALKPSEVSRTPTYRSSVPELAKMFRYCLRPSAPKGEKWSDSMRARQILHRRQLLRFLQASVATWARPDAAHDISTAPERDQWISSARILRLNPKGRRQTNKYRPEIPVPERFGLLLDRTDGFFVEVKSVRKAFEAMLDELGLPRQRETGMKLIRRSMAHEVRKRIGEAQWRQGEIMLGHRKASTSDLYALFDPANLGLALEATTAIIDEIETDVPGAFAGTTPDLKLVKGKAG